MLVFVLCCVYCVLRILFSVCVFCVVVHCGWIVVCIVMCVLRIVFCVSCSVYHGMSAMYCVLWCVHVGFCIV